MTNMEMLDLLWKMDRGYKPTPKRRRVLDGVTVIRFSYFNNIIDLPKSIGQLTNLRELHLMGTSLPALPESIGQLAKLRVLNLRNTLITALPESIGKLSKLQMLYLSGTQITALPESIGQLASLQTLHLSNTQITAFPESIGRLKKLQELSLHNAPITALPESIGQLANLQTLDLGGTKITALPESIRQLSNLQWLDLGGTELTALPESIGQLANLQTLNLYGTIITSLPESIGQLSNLQWLDLGSTKLTALPEFIGRLQSLRYLGLMGLTLPAIPESLALRRLCFKDASFTDSLLYEFGYFFDGERTGVDLTGVTLTEQDKSVFLQNNAALIAALYQKDGQLTLRECRVIFLGDGAAGKSYTIRRFLAEGKKETKEKPYETNETPGVEIADYRVERGDESFTIHFWDFGGQQLLHSMHRCFLTEETCYVVMVKTRETTATERARYWLRNVTAFAPRSPILLFVNCWENDDGQRSIDESALRSEFPMISQVIYCSAKQAEVAIFRAKVMEPLKDMAARAEGCTKKVPRRWDAVRRAIEAESKEHNYLTRERYHALCAGNGIEDDSAPALLSYFNNLGVCFSYHRDAEKKELTDYKLLNPVWLTNGIYAVIKEGMAQAQEGKINDAAIQLMLGNPAPVLLDGKTYSRTAPELRYNPEECVYLLTVAEAHELCYRVDAERVFFPALCGTNTPAQALTPPEDYPNKAEYAFSYKYLPDSVLHKLMIRCLRKGYVIAHSWLSGMILRCLDQHSVTVRIVENETLRIEVWSKPDHPAWEIFPMLRMELLSINRALNLTAKELIVEGQDSFSVLQLVKTHQKGLSEIVGNNTDRDYQVYELLERFYDAETLSQMRIIDGSVQILPLRYHRIEKSDPFLRRAIFEAYGTKVKDGDEEVYTCKCRYCGKTLIHQNEMEIDHILASKYRQTKDSRLNLYLAQLEQKGFDLNEPNYIENYFPSCGPCNKRKSNNVPDADALRAFHDNARRHTPEVLRLLKKYKPNRCWDDDLELGRLQPPEP